MADPRKYSDAEVRAIIDRAVNTESRGGDVSHEQLVAIASEVGISRESIEKAAREIEDRRDLESAKQRVIAQRRRGFASHAWSYLLVNAFLFAINYLTTPGEWWVLFPALGWGLGLLFHARAALARDVSERAVLREQRRQQRTRVSSGLTREHASRLRLEPESSESSAELGAAEDATHAAEPARRHRREDE